MAYNLIDVPGKKLDDIINQNIEKSEKILIIVSFIFEKGLNLIFDKLYEFNDPQNYYINNQQLFEMHRTKSIKKLMKLKNLEQYLFFWRSKIKRELSH